jgi:hypothetical protein
MKYVFPSDVSDSNGCINAISLPDYGAHSFMKFIVTTQTLPMLPSTQILFPNEELKKDPQIHSPLQIFHETH